MFFSDSLIVFNNNEVGWGIGLVCVFVFGIIIGYKVGKWLSKKTTKQQMMSASQVREIYRQVGRTPTEKEIRKMLAAVNNP